jgi:DNA-binding response OmpR family regulator
LTSTPTGTIDLPGCAVDLERREVTRDGRTTELSQREAELLRYLASARGHPVTRDEILQRVWGLDPHGITTRTIDMHIARLREKLGGDVLRTVRGQGYMLYEERPGAEAGSLRVGARRSSRHVDHRMIDPAREIQRTLP